MEAWEGDFSAIKEDITITATYTETVNKYTVTFDSNDGNVGEIGGVKYKLKGAEKEHADIVHLVQTNNIPAIFVGKEFEKIDSLSLHFSDVESCIEYLKDEHITNSFILIKGSHGIHLEKIIEYL